MTAIPIPGTVLLEKPGYGNVLKLTLKGYMPLIDEYDSLAGFIDTLTLSNISILLTGIS